MSKVPSTETQLRNLKSAFKEIMLDMEFLDTQPSAAIMSIGAVAFDSDTGKLGEEFYIEVDVQDCLNHGMTISRDTLLFWLQDHAELTRLLTDGKALMPLALIQLFSFVRSVQRDNEDAEGKKTDIWSCGSIDLEIIRFAVKQVALDIPWKYWNERDYRTLRNEFPWVEIEYDGKKHNALDDARNQARHLIAIRRGVLRSFMNTKLGVPYENMIDGDKVSAAQAVASLGDNVSTALETSQRIDDLTSNVDNNVAPTVTEPDYRLAHDSRCMGCKHHSIDPDYEGGGRMFCTHEWNLCGCQATPKQLTIKMQIKGCDQLEKGEPK